MRDFNSLDQTRQPAQPIFSSTQEDAAAQDAAQQSPMKEDAAPLQEDADPQRSDEKFSLTVNDIRVQLEHLGISKSKDTIQRYCRDGELECRKLGMFGRYKVTEHSVEKQIEKLLHDEGADSGTQVHEAAPEEISDGMQVHEAVDDEKTNPDKELQEPASKEMQVHEAARSSDLEMEPLVIELRKAITRKEEETDFLQEELRDRRSQTKALNAVINAFEKNAETQNLLALADRAQKDNADNMKTYSAQVVEEEGEGDNVQNQKSEEVL